MYVHKRRQDSSSTATRPTKAWGKEKRKKAAYKHLGGVICEGGVGAYQGFLPSRSALPLARGAACRPSSAQEVPGRCARAVSLAGLCRCESPLSRRCTQHHPRGRWEHLDILRLAHQVGLHFNVKLARSRGMPPAPTLPTRGPPFRHPCCNPPSPTPSQERESNAAVFRSSPRTREKSPDPFAILSRPATTPEPPFPGIDNLQRRYPVRCTASAPQSAVWARGAPEVGSSRGPSARQAGS